MNTNNIIGGAAAVGEGDNHHCHQARLKKGPWSGAEDAILMEYVKKHGEGNWNSVQRNSGLTRCGKSCRLRWANHLRPNLKKGCFTPEEERIIIELHAKLGNKWARMASQLPGRTDNEIKNFWNTRMKRRQRSGLTLYPQEPREEAAPAFHFHKKNDHQQKRPQYSSPTSSLSSFLNSFPPKNSYVPYYPLFNSPNLSSSNPLEYPFIQSHLPSSLYSDDPTHHVGGCGLSLPLSPLNSPYSPSPSSSSTHMYNQNHGLQAITTTPEQSIVHYENADDLENNMSFTSLIMGTHVKPIGITVPGLKLELPSNQTVIPYPRSPASISTSRDTNNKGENDQAWTSEDGRNSGLLDALLMEAKTLSYGRDKSVVKDSKVGPVDKGKCVVDEPKEEDEERQVEEEKQVDKRVKLPLTNGSQESGENQRCDISSSQSSIDEAASSIDEDLLSLLSNFPSSMPLPDWYNRRTSYESNNELPSGTINDNKGINVDPNASLPRTTTTGDGTPTLEWPWDSCPWNNMPGIC